MNNREENEPIMEHKAFSELKFRAGVGQTHVTVILHDTMQSHSTAFLHERRLL